MAAYPRSSARHWSIQAQDERRVIEREYVYAEPKRASKEGDFSYTREGDFGEI